jgi:hypothetical protein
MSDQALRVLRMRQRALMFKNGLVTSAESDVMLANPPVAFEVL